MQIHHIIQLFRKFIFKYSRIIPFFVFFCFLELKELIYSNCHFHPDLSTHLLRLLWLVTTLTEKHVLLKIVASPPSSASHLAFDPFVLPLQDLNAAPEQ